MPIRPANSSDEPAMAAILATAFFDESLFGPVVHPHRHKYPDDVKIFWSERVRKAWQTRDEKLFVAITTESKKEKVVGVAVWQRQGDDETAKKVEKSWDDVGKQASDTHRRRGNSQSIRKRLPTLTHNTKSCYRRN
jgi:hypothetical protein